MYQLQQTDTFVKWFAGLKDKKAKARVIARLDSARLGNLGDCKSVGGGIREMRIHVGAGYRLYFAQQQKVVLLLLCGGSKTNQSRDIERARRLLNELEE